jgi:hypothetical protein
MADEVVVSTHLDDAVFSCFSVLSPEALVVTVLAGIPPPGVVGTWDMSGGAVDSHDRVRERRAEDERALVPSGTKWLHLDFTEAQHVCLEGLTAPTHENLVAGLRPVLSTAVTVYCPAGIWNSEHKSVRDAVLALRPDAVLYADLPYALRPDMGGFELPPEIASTERHRHEIALDDLQGALKVQAARCYVTQLPQLIDIFGPFVNEHDLRREVFWLVTPR